MPHKLLEAAIRYTDLGWPIFPLKPGTKVPITAHGVKDATTDLDSIQKWWAQWPLANIGLACGAQSAYVIDIDLKNGNNGYESIREHGTLCPQVSARTPSGGEHQFYRPLPNKPANKNGILPGVDIRGDGYYVVLSPSVLDSAEQPYAWHDGHSPFEARLDSYPEFMLSLSGTSRPTQQAQLPVRVVPVVRPANDDLYGRALRYFDGNVEYACTGNAGHNKLLWAVRCCLVGLRMSRSQAEQFLAAEYNPRCSPPWDLSDAKDAREWKHKFDEVERKPGELQHGWILDDPEYAPALELPAGIDIGAMIQNSKPEPVTVPGPVINIDAIIKSSEPSELGFLCQPHGLAGDVCSYINSRATYKQPWLAVAASLTYLGTLFGQKVRTEEDNRTNIYTLGIAPSSAGKQGAMDSIRELSFQAGSDDMLGGDGVTGASAIECRVHSEPCTLFLWDEMGFFLKSTKGGNEHKQGIVPFLMRLFSMSNSIYKGQEYADNEKQRTIVQPCLSFYGTSTMARFAQGISTDELEDGWIARVLMFASLSEDPEYFGGNKLTPPPTELLTKIQKWVVRSKCGPPVDMEGKEGNFAAYSRAPVGASKDAIPDPTVYIATAGAKRKYEELRIWSREHKSDYRPLWLKSTELASRIGLILAAGRSFNKPEVTEEDADYACRLVQYCVSEFITLVAPKVVDSHDEHLYARIVELVRGSGKRGISREAVRQKMRKAKTRFPAIFKIVMANKEILMVRQVIKGSKAKELYIHEDYIGEIERIVNQCKKLYG